MVTNVTRAIVSHLNASIGQERAVHLDIFVKLHIECLKIYERVQGGYNSKNGFVNHFANSSVIAFDAYTLLNLKIASGSIEETVETSKLFNSNIPISCVDN